MIMTTAQPRMVECEALKPFLYASVARSVGQRFEIDEERASKLVGSGHIRIIGATPYSPPVEKPDPTPEEVKAQTSGPPTWVRSRVRCLLGSTVASVGQEILIASEREAIDLTLPAGVSGVIRASPVNPLTSRGEAYRNKVVSIDATRGIPQCGWPTY